MAALSPRAPAALALIALSALAQPAGAATRRVPADFATLAAAIGASASGDTVLVAPGTYAERIALAPGVTVRAEDGAGTVVLDAGHAGAAVVAQDLPPGTRIEGLRLTGGAGADIGGATLGGDLAVLGGNLEVLDCVFDGAHADYGGATGASNAFVTFRRCTWSGTTASYGGGHFQAGGTLTLEEGAIAGTSAGAGGGLYVTGGANGSLRDCVLTGAQATGDGGGLRLDAATLTLSNVRVDGARAGGRGGGIAMAAGGQVIATFSVLVDCGSGLGGGAFYVSCDAASPAAPAAARGRTTAAADCALLVLTSCDVLLARGAAPAAGAVTGAAVLHVTRSLVAGNASGLACLDPRATLDVGCSDLYRNGGPDLSGTCVPSPSSGNIAADPRLCDLAGRDFGLCAGSPLLDPGCGDAFWGAAGLACAACGPTPARPLTWGRVKAIYRG